MTKCQVCPSERSISIDAKCGDKCSITATTGYDEIANVGYVPSGIGIGGGDYLKLTICLNCHTVRNFPDVENDELREAIKDM